MARSYKHMSCDMAIAIRQSHLSGKPCDIDDVQVAVLVIALQTLENKRKRRERKNANFYALLDQAFL